MTWIILTPTLKLTVRPEHIDMILNIKHIARGAMTVAAAMAAVCGCDFLNVSNEGRSTIPAFYSDASSVKSALDGTYSLTYEFYDKYMILYPEVAGDLTRVQPSASDWIRQFNFTSDETDETTPVGFIWKSGYEIILNANEIIHYAPYVAQRYPGQAKLIDNYIAQAYFLRALASLDLCLTYAQTYTYTSDASHLGIAVLTYVPDVKAKIRRSSAADSYAQIVKDLGTALSMFSADYAPGPSYAAAAACKALLARVSLYMGRYSDAAGYATDVIEDYGLQLTPRKDYRDMFCRQATGTESILRLNGKYSTSNLRSIFSYIEPKIFPSQKVLSTLTDEKDIRSSLLHHTNDNDTYDGICMKYADINNIDEKERHTDPFILRLSEMYLIRAESYCALGETGKAASDIAALRARAYEITIEEAMPEYSDSDDLDQQIMQERIKELHLEGHRLFDITRRHENLSRGSDTGATILEIDYPDERFILPIPLVELEANKDMQPNPVNKTQR